MMLHFLSTLIKWWLKTHQLHTSQSLTGLAKFLLNITSLTISFFEWLNCTSHRCETISESLFSVSHFRLKSVRLAEKNASLAKSQIYYSPLSPILYPWTKSSHRNSKDKCSFYSFLLIYLYHDLIILTIQFIICLWNIRYQERWQGGNLYAND